MARVAAVDNTRWLFGVMEKINMAGENALRVATFRSVIEAGGTDAEAASAAANVTVNFNRKGEMGTQLSALYLFFNPNVQGTQVLLDTLLNSPHKAQAWAASGALAGLAFTLAAMARGGDDEDEKKWRTIPSYIKDRNLILKAGDQQIVRPRRLAAIIAHVDTVEREQRMNKVGKRGVAHRQPAADLRQPVNL